MAGPLVLVIDDDDRLRELYRINLEMRGAEVVDVGNGDDGLAVARSRMPAAIVLDLTMPGTDGWSVLQALKNDVALSAIPVIVLTGHTDEEIEESVRKAGAVAFVAKPVDTDDFVRVVLRHAGG
jgi:CheY-like chemotaxis protein